MLRPWSVIILNCFPPFCSTPPTHPTLWECVACIRHRVAQPGLGRLPTTYPGNLGAPEPNWSWQGGGCCCKPGAWILELERWKMTHFGAQVGLVWLEELGKLDWQISHWTCPKRSWFKRVIRLDTPSDILQTLWKWNLIGYLQIII